MTESLEPTSGDSANLSNPSVSRFARHLVSLRGNSGRLEFFLLGLVSWIAIFMVSLVLNIIELLVGVQEATLTTIWVVIAIPIYLWLTFAVTMRRIHDLGHSGWTILVLLIPFVNLIFVFYLLMAPGRSA